MVSTVDFPAAPPGANELQLELWRRILSKRLQQIQTLSPSNFRTFASDITLDLKVSRWKNDGGGDLAERLYSNFLMCHPPSRSTTAQDVARHVYALFYSSIDDRLCHDERKYGLDAVKRSFLSLETALKDQTLDSSNIRKGNQSHERINNQTGNSSRTGISQKDDSPSNTQEISLLKMKPAPPLNPTVSGKVQNEHDMNVDNAVNEEDQNNQRESSHTLDSNKAMSNQTHHSGNSQGSQKACEFSPDREGWKNDQHGTIDQNNNNCEEEVPKRKRSRKEATGNLDANDAADEQPQYCNPEEKQNVVHGRNFKESGREEHIGIETQKVLPVNAKKSFEGKSDSEPNVGVAHSVSAESIFLPPPKSHFSLSSIAFEHDNFNPFPASGSLHPREACTVAYDAGFNLDGSGSCLDDKAFIDVRERLERWDPYWKILKEFGHREVPARGGGMTKASTRTTSCLSAFNLSKNVMKDFPKSCAEITVDLPRECVSAHRSNSGELSSTAGDNPWGLKWRDGGKPPKTGDRRLLLRMLPLRCSEKEKKRCDTHLWPIGSFLQLSRHTEERAILLSQRQQQSHDPKLWKGLCRPLDITAILPNASSPFSLKICTKETIKSTPTYKQGSRVIKMFEGDNGEMRPFIGTIKRYDAEFQLYQVVYEDGDAEELTDKEVASILEKKDVGDQNERKLLTGSFAIHLAVCEYIGPVDLFHQLVGVIQTIPLDSSQRMARQYLEKNIVSIDSDSEGDNASSSSSLTFSLICPISKRAIDTPVRGQRCKHMQCFDMETWLRSNMHISGGRWRCGVCEEFIAATDLVRCGLFEAMLREHKDKVSGIRDKVSFKSDGSWYMKEENKLRYSNKSRGVRDKGSVGTSIDRARTDTNNANQKRPQPEVIDLL